MYVKNSEVFHGQHSDAPVVGKLHWYGWLFQNSIGGSSGLTGGHINESFA